VLTSARLRIRPAPEARHLRGFSFARVPAGLEGIRRVMQRGLRPAVVRLYDEFDSWMALRPHDKQKQSGTPTGLPALDPARKPKKNLLRGLIGGALDRPRALNALVELGAQKLLRPGCLLIVGVEGAEPRAGTEARLVFGELSRAGGKDLGEEPGKSWLARRYAVSYNMSKVFESGAFVDTMEVAATWERLLDLYEGVRAALSRHAFVMAHFSHAYSEGCSIYFTFAGHAPTRATAEAKYDALWREGLHAANRAGGTISHHHGVGLLKAAFMVEEHGEAMALFQALKTALDPDGVLNPGKMGLSG
jgi:alkyldihydroxyacetonephosphate synthase